VREGDQLGVTDQADQAGGDQELEDREVVDLREDDLPDPGERRRAGAGRFGGGEALAHPPLASVAVDGTDPGELRFVRGVDAPELAEARGRRAGGERGRERRHVRGGQVGRLELGDHPQELVQEPALREAERRRDAGRLEGARQHDRRHLRLEDVRRRAQVAGERVGQLGKGRDPVAEEAARRACPLAQDALHLQGRRVDVEDVGRQRPVDTRTYPSA